VIHTVDAGFPHLAQTPGAHVVAMASTSPNTALRSTPSTAATKFFVRGLTEALNIEYREHGILVSAIYVAYVQTGMVFDAAVKPASIDVWREGRATARRRGRVEGSARNRVHWRVGLDARLINFAVRVLGSGVAPIYRRIMSR